MTTATQVAVANDSFPGTTGLTTFAELRRQFTGLIKAPGILEMSLRNLLSATSTWSLNIAGFTCALMRDVPANLYGTSSNGATFGMNPQTYGLTLPAAPNSQSIMHTIFFKYNDPANGEDGLTVLDYVSSGVAASPTKAAVPDGAIELGWVTIPAGATNLQSAGVVINNMPRRAIIHGSPVVVAGAGQRDLTISSANGGPFDLTTTSGQIYLQNSGILIRRNDTGILEQYYAKYDSSTNPKGATDAGWYPAPGEVVRARAYRSTVGNIDSGSARTALFMDILETAYMQGGDWSLSSGGLKVPYKGEWEVRVRVTWPNSDGSGVRLTSILRNDTIESNGIIDSRPGLASTQTYITIYETVKLNAGDTVKAGVAQTSGSRLQMPIPPVDVTLWYKGMI